MFLKSRPARPCVRTATGALPSVTGLINVKETVWGKLVAPTFTVPKLTGVTVCVFVACTTSVTVALAFGEKSTVSFATKFTVMG